MPTETIYEEDLLKLYEQGERDFRQCELSIVDMERAVLADSDFSGQELEEVHLVEANLRSVKFRGCGIWQTSFHNANLQNADFTNVKFSEVFFIGADLRNACFRGAELREVGFMKANLNGCDFENAVLIDCVMPDGSTKTSGAT